MEEVDDLCKRKVKDITAQLVEDNPEIKVKYFGCFFPSLRRGSMKRKEKFIVTF